MTHDWWLYIDETFEPPRDYFESITARLVSEHHEGKIDLRGFKEWGKRPIVEYLDSTIKDDLRNAMLTGVPTSLVTLMEEVLKKLVEEMSVNISIAAFDDAGLGEL